MLLWLKLKGMLTHDGMGLALLTLPMAILFMAAVREQDFDFCNSLHFTDRNLSGTAARRKLVPMHSLAFFTSLANH